MEKWGKQAAESGRTEEGGAGGAQVRGPSRTSLHLLQLRLGEASGRRAASFLDCSVSSRRFVLHSTGRFKCLLISGNTNKQTCPPGAKDKT